MVVIADRGRVTRWTRHCRSSDTRVKGTGENTWKTKSGNCSHSSLEYQVIKWPDRSRILGQPTEQDSQNKSEVKTFQAINERMEKLTS